MRAAHSRRSASKRARIMLMAGALILGTAVASGDDVGAAEPTLTEILATLGFTNTVEVADQTFPAGSYEIHLLAEYAAFHASNTVSHYAVGTNDFEVLIVGPEGNFGLTNPQISVLLVQPASFGLTFETGSNRFFTETSRNPDGIQHARVFADLNDPGSFLIGFEDVLGGGDLDFQDMVFRLNPSEGPVAPLTSLPGLSVIPRIYVDEKDTPGLANADRELVVSTVLTNSATSPQELVLCPMLHVHDPSEPDETGTVLTITASGGQAVTGTYIHPRTMRYPFPDPTPLVIPGSAEVVVNYRTKLSEFTPSLASFTRGEIRDKILEHAAVVSSTLYVDYFFEDAGSGQFMDPGESFQCPHGANTWWKFGIEDPDDFDEAFHWIDLTFTNMFSTLTVPLTIHTSETAGAVLDGSPLDAYLEVTPNCTLVECPPVAGAPGSSGRPTVVWTSDPVPGAVFTIDEIEEMGSITIDTPDDMPEGSVIGFTVLMREAGTDRLLSEESKRFALDHAPPVINEFEFDDSSGVELTASALVQDQAASVAFVELLVSRDGGATYAGVPMARLSGDYLGPSRFEVTRPLSQAPGQTLFAIRVVDEADNAAQTDAHLHDVPLPIEVKPGSDPAPIRVGSLGRTPVAILSTPHFDALTAVDVSTLTFGATGDEDSLARCSPGPNDVDGDGLGDLICHFRTRDAGFATSDTEAVLKGATVAGVPFVGADAVIIVP